VMVAAAPTNPQVGQSAAGGGTTATPPATPEKVETPATPDPATKPEEKPAETKTVSAPRHRPGRRKPGKKGETQVARRGSTSDDLLGSPSAGSSKGTKAGSSRKHDAIDDLIDGAVGSKKKPKKTTAVAAAAPDSSLPETLTRAQIQGGMRNIKAKVQGCYDRFKVPGMANVQVKIARNGRVSSARVVGMFAGTPTGACVQAAAKSAQFDSFKGAPITITYPFILR